MRIVYFVSLFPCWSETFIVREMKALIGLGVDIHIVSLRPPSEALVQEDARELLPLVHYPPPLPRQLLLAAQEALRSPWVVARLFAMTSISLWRRPAEWAKTIATVLRTLALVPELRQLEPDRLHAHWATYPSTSALLASSCLDKPFSFTAHAHDLWLHDHLLVEKLQRADFAVTISEFNRRWLLERFTRQRPKLHPPLLRIVHCGVPLERLAFRRVVAAPGRRLIVAVGRLDPIKGFRHLVDACAELQRRDVDFECQLIGDGPLRAELQQAIQQARLGSRVHLMGALPQAQVQALLDQSCLFVMPSVVTGSGDRDGIPVALMEAMAMGVPVVSTTVSGIPELVEHGRSGLLVAPGDALALADAIAQQLAHRPRAQAMAVRARLRVELQFDATIEARKLHAAFLGSVAVEQPVRQGAFA